MDTIFKKIGELGIVPVVKIENEKNAIPLGKALIDANLPIAEITFRTEAAEQAIKKITTNIPDLLVGAGTVLTVEQVKKAVGAGSKFIVTPGTNPKVVEYCVKNNIPIAPGINNPTQIEMALDYGLKVVKFFPAEASGGLSLLKAMSAPYGDIKFIPTGGISIDNLNTYLSFNKVLACGGSWIVKTNLISDNKFDAIKALTSQALVKMLGFELMRVGIYEETEEKTMNSANEFSNLFNFTLKEGNNSVFALSESSSGVEIINKNNSENNGHLTIGTNHIHRAIAYLERKGINILPDTAVNKNGKLVLVYLDKEISGFAVHLVQK